MKVKGLVMVWRCIVGEARGGLGFRVDPCGHSWKAQAARLRVI